MRVNCAICLWLCVEDGSVARCADGCDVRVLVCGNNNSLSVDVFEFVVLFLALCGA